MIAPLHNHTEASALDGLATPREIAERCQCIGCTAVGITDHGTVAGHLEFGKTMRKFDIKPIYGCEFYLGTKTEFAKNERDGYHFIAGAMTDAGLRNIWRMVDEASRPENYRYVGRITLDNMRRHSEGVFATSACIASIIGQCIVKEDKGDPYWWLNQFRDIYRDNFFIELHTYPGEEHEYLNSCLVQMADETGTPVVYATDAHFASPDQYKAHDAYVAMTSGDSIYLDPADRKMWHPNVLYIQSEDEIRANLAYLPGRVVDEAIANSVVIADQCSAELPEVKRHLAPFIPVECPWLRDDLKIAATAAEVFIDLVEDGIVERYGEDNEEAWERAAREMDVFLDSGLEHYFLQAWDFCQFCNANEIIRGPGRGSAAGAIVSYALGITDVDPLHYDLVFERFWNPGRAKGFPDIDNDFPKGNRKQVRQYLMDRWGADKVRAIGTTMRLKPKAAIDKAYKVAGVTFEEKEALKKIVDGTPDIDILGPDSVGWSRDTDPGEFEGLVDGRPKYNPKSIYVMEHVGSEILDWVEAQPEGRWEYLIRFLELVEMVCSRVSGYGVHPSGVVVSDVGLADELPCMFNRSQDVQVTCFPMDAVDARMFVKQDLLGLRNLDTIADWQAQMREQGVEVNWSGMDKQEWPEEMWRLLDEGYTRGIFQIEDGYGRQLCKEFKPRSVEDLSIIVALNRPGPIRSGAPDSFIKRRRGEEEVEFDHPVLEPLLERTYGWFLYQEQVINYFSALGYDLSDADAVRKMLGKKDPQAFTALVDGQGEWEGKGYVEIASGQVGESVARTIIGKIREFAKYSFNKAHSVCYAVIGFRTLYAKWKAPAEFIIASIRTIGDDPKKAEKTAGFIGEGRRMGIEVLPPSIDNSREDIAVVDGHIYFGFSNIKGIGKTAAKYLMWLREHYDVTTPEALATALDIEDEQWQTERDAAKAEGRAFKKKSPKQSFPANRIEALAQAGAFDFYVERDITLVQRQKLEKELLGVILTDECAAVFERNAVEIAEYLSEMDEYEPTGGYEYLSDEPTSGIVVAMPGVVAGISEKTTKKDGKPMGIVTIEYEGHEAEFVVFPQAWRSHRFLWRERTPGLFTLKVSERGVHFEDGLRLN